MDGFSACGPSWRATIEYHTVACSPVAKPPQCELHVSDDVLFISPDGSERRAHHAKSGPLFLRPSLHRLPSVGDPFHMDRLVCFPVGADHMS